jgi:hypothetical protein
LGLETFEKFSPKLQIWFFEMSAICRNRSEL